ncbi:MAG: ADP/ATP-dependent (S)-NAD(P)H-hydrate dehydratase [Planctomycetota bacterium]
MQQTTDIPSPPARPDDGHKGTFGTVIVVGGCATMVGAPALCARAAFRGGAGLVKIATPPEVLPYALTVEPSATGLALGVDADTACEAIDAADPDGRAVLAVGPGLGQGDAQTALVMRLLAGPRAVVLDADGLNALAATLSEGDTAAIAASLGDAGPPQGEAAGSAPALHSDAAIPDGGTRCDISVRLLTPHPGEFRRLAQPLGVTQDPTDPAQRPDAAAALAKTLNAVVLLKGQHTVVSDGQRYAINTTGNPALATAGSGDVLTGLIAALLAQGMSAFDAARLAAHVHGVAADHWAGRHGRAGMRAVELADGLPDVLQALR